MSDFETTRWMALIERLAAARGRDIPPATIKGIYRLFDEMGAKQAESITSLIEEFENVPSNLVGCVKKIWSERKYRLEQEQLYRDKWKAEEGCTTSEEWKWYFAIITEIFDWHYKKLVKRNSEGLTAPIDILEWKRLGCPKTWCPIHDHFFEGFLKAHNLPGKKCEEFLKKYYEILISERNKRLTTNKGEISYGSNSLEN